MTSLRAAAALAMAGAASWSCTPATPAVPGATVSVTQASATDSSPAAGAAGPAEGTPLTLAGSLVDGSRRVLPFTMVERAPGGPATVTVAGPPAPSTMGAEGAPAATCPAGIAQRDGSRLVVDRQPFAFFGVNAPYLTEPAFPSDAVDPLVRDLAARGVNTVRVWFLPGHDPERLAGVLEAGARYGVRTVVVLEDNVNKGRDWFFGDGDEQTYRPHLARTVERFRDRPEILAWEVINEPNCGERYDVDCLKTMKDWLTMASRMVKEIDGCHLVSTGMIGAGNFEEDRASYRQIHSRDTIDLVSAHRGSTDERGLDLDIASDLDKPIYLGEIYDAGYDEGCNPLDGGAELDRRAERVKDDLRSALADGVDGYLLWDYAAGSIEDDGQVRHYCGRYGFERDDPLWKKLAEDGTVAPVPWQG